jgi:hypothetical protein
MPIIPDSRLFDQHTLTLLWSKSRKDGNACTSLERTATVRPWGVVAARWAVATTTRNVHSESGAECGCFSSISGLQCKIMGEAVPSL